MCVCVCLHVHLIKAGVAVHVKYRDEYHVPDIRVVCQIHTITEERMIHKINTHNDGGLLKRDVCVW